MSKRLLDDLLLLALVLGQDGHKIRGYRSVQFEVLRKFLKVVEFNGFVGMVFAALSFCPSQPFLS